MFNISVDASGSRDFSISQNDYNEQESLLEIFLEKLLGFENAFAEIENDDAAGNSSL